MIRWYITVYYYYYVSDCILCYVTVKCKILSAMLSVVITKAPFITKMKVNIIEAPL